MADLSDLVTQTGVIAALKAQSKKQLLQELAHRAAQITGLAERTIFETLLERERLGTTGVGHGIAIPHGRSPTLQSPRGALLRLLEPVDFGGSEPVDLVFAMAVPEHYTHQHLMLLSELAEIFSDGDVRHALRAADDATALKLLLDHPQPASP